jgi:hypothetical protein
MVRGDIESPNVAKKASNPSHSYLKEVDRINSDLQRQDINGKRGGLTSLPLMTPNEKTKSRADEFGKAKHFKHDSMRNLLENH